MKPYLLFAVLVVSALLLTACDGDEDTAAPSTVLDSGQISDIQVTCLVPSPTGDGCTQIDWKALNPAGTTQLRTTIGSATSELNPEQLQIDFHSGNLLDLLDDIADPAVRVQIDDRALVQLERLSASGAMDDVVKAFPKRCRIVRVFKVRFPVCTP